MVFTWTVLSESKQSWSTTQRVFVTLYLVQKRRWKALSLFPSMLLLTQWAFSALKKRWRTIDLLDGIDGVDGVVQDTEETKMSLVSNVVVMGTFTVLLH